MNVSTDFNPTLRPSILPMILRLFLILALFSLTSCSTMQSILRPRLPALAEAALRVALRFQKITPSQATFILDHGRLILQAEESGTTEARLLALSTTVVNYAESIGKLSPQDAEALREAGSIALAAPRPIPAPAVLFGPLQENPLLTSLNPSK